MRKRQSMMAPKRLQKTVRKKQKTRGPVKMGQNKAPQQTHDWMRAKKSRTRQQRQVKQTRAQEEWPRLMTQGHCQTSHLAKAWEIWQWEQGKETATAWKTRPRKQQQEKKQGRTRTPAPQTRIGWTMIHVRRLQRQMNYPQKQAQRKTTQIRK